MSRSKATSIATWAKAMPTTHLINSALARSMLVSTSPRSAPNSARSAANSARKASNSPRSAARSILVARPDRSIALIMTRC
jgi:hypothetical protein